MSAKATKLTNTRKAVPSKTSNASRMAKANAESTRYQTALATQINDERIGDFDNLTAKSFAEKCGHALSMYVLETINNIQEAEVHNDTDYNQFPSDEYVLLDEKLNPGGNKRPIKHKDGKTTKIQKKRVPKKKGHKSVDDLVESEPEVDEAEVIVVNDDIVETKSNTSSEKKPKSKKGVVQIQKNAKILLSFIVNRFVYEIYSTDSGKRIDNNVEFTKYVLENVSGDFATQMTKVVIPAVDLLGHTVGDMNDHKFTNILTTAIDGNFADRQGMAGMIARYLVTYFKLLGTVIGNQIWLQTHAVKSPVIESAMRILNIGSHAHLVAFKTCNSGEFDYGLSTGIIAQTHEFVNALNPPPTEMEKNERAKKRSSGKNTKSNQVVDDDDDEEVQKTNIKKKSASVPVKNTHEDEEEEVDDEEEEEEEEVEEVDEEEVQKPNIKKKSTSCSAKNKSANKEEDEEDEEDEEVNYEESGDDSGEEIGDDDEVPVCKSTKPLRKLKRRGNN
jgi:hypothetical protein